MDTVHAVIENGVFRPIAPVTLPENSQVAFEPRIVPAAASENAAASEELQVVYSILSERYESGFTDTAARHNEHQP
jgi:predicted DNA-binding antitoxin AbrB/MazE fold protein